MRPSTIRRPTVVPPSISTPVVINQDPPTDVTTETITRRPQIPTRNRPFPPKIIRPPNPVPATPNEAETETAEPGNVKTAGAPFLPTFGKRPFVKEKDNKNELRQGLEDEVKRKETINDNINPAIVEGIPGEFRFLCTLLLTANT